MIKPWLKCSALQLLTVLLLTGCAQTSPVYEPSSKPVIPALDSKLTTLQRPAWCSPNFTKAVLHSEETSRRVLKELDSRFNQ